MIRFAQVVRTNSSRRTCDLVMTDSAEVYAEVSILSTSASSDGGSWSVPSVPKPLSDGSAGGLSTPGRKLIAAVDFTASGRPIVTGFSHMNGGQVVFKQDDRDIHLHGSGSYTTVAPDGSIEIFHPSGSYLRIGTGPHEDLGQHAADGNWQVPAGAAEPTVTLQTPNFTLTVAPGGVVTLAATGAVMVTASMATVTAAQVDLIADQVNLGATGGRKVVLDGDPVSGGVVHASSTKTLAV